MPPHPPRIDSLREHAAAAPPGAFVEIGVYQGDTAAVQEHFKEFQVLDTGKALVEIGSG